MLNKELGSKILNSDVLPPPGELLINTTLFHNESFEFFSIKLSKTIGLYNLRKLASDSILSDALIKKGFLNLLLILCVY
ncbi:hypothetical protein BMS3Abin03_00023 [bacterium BMS3Abin03]|nr:hypothetical protein BMS3Abin03_00023 [bacterium BMS3Abin03]